MTAQVHGSITYSWAETVSELPKVDLLSGEKKPLQGDVPDLSNHFGKFCTNSIWVIPHEAKYWSSDYKKYVFALAKHNTVIAFNRGDYPVSLKHPRVISIQVAKNYGDSRPALLVPYNVENLEMLSIRAYGRIPKISFVGYVPKLSMGRLWKSCPHLFKHPIKSQGVTCRQIGTCAMKHKGDWHTNTITRKTYGGVPRLLLNPESHRSEFLESVEESDYVFAPRGDANSSRRLFEILSAGRIPVIPNSGSKFPILPKSRCEFPFVSIAASAWDIQRKVVRNWSSLGSNTYNELQLQLRLIYLRSLDYRTFMRQLFSIRSEHEMYSLLQ